MAAFRITPAPSQILVLPAPLTQTNVAYRLQPVRLNLQSWFIRRGRVLPAKIAAGAKVAERNLIEGNPFQLITFNLRIQQDTHGTVCPKIECALSSILLHISNAVFLSSSPGFRTSPGNILHLGASPNMICNQYDTLLLRRHRSTQCADQMSNTMKTRMLLVKLFEHT